MSWPIQCPGAMVSWMVPCSPDTKEGLALAGCGAAERIVAVDATTAAVVASHSLRDDAALAVDVVFFGWNESECVLPVIRRQRIIEYINVCVVAVAVAAIVILVLVVINNNLDWIFLLL